MFSGVAASWIYHLLPIVRAKKPNLLLSAVSLLIKVPRSRLTCRGGAYSCHSFPCYLGRAAPRVGAMPMMPPRGVCRTLNTKRAVNIASSVGIRIVDQFPFSSSFTHPTTFPSSRTCQPCSPHYNSSIQRVAICSSDSDAAPDCKPNLSFIQCKRYSRLLTCR